MLLHVETLKEKCLKLILSYFDRFLLFSSGLNRGSVSLTVSRTSQSGVDMSFILSSSSTLKGMILSLLESET